MAAPPSYASEALDVRHGRQSRSRDARPRDLDGRRRHPSEARGHARGRLAAST
jgi:hypothetical protein